MKTGVSNRRTIWKTPTPYFSDQQLVISSDGRIAASSPKELTIFSFDNDYNNHIIGSLRIDNVNSDSDKDDRSKLELFSFPDVKDGVSIVSVSWVSFRTSEMLSVLFSNGALLLFESSEGRVEKEVSGSIDCRIHTSNLKLLANVSEELATLLSGDGKGFYVSTCVWSTTATIQGLLPSSAYLYLVSKSIIYLINVSATTTLFQFDLACQTDCSALISRHGPCAQLKSFYDDPSSSEYLFLALEQAVIRMKAYRGEGTVRIDRDGEWLGEEADTLIQSILDQNTLLLTRGMDIYLLCSESVPQLSRLPRIHTSNITSVLVQDLGDNKLGQVSVVDSLFLSGSLGGESLSWRLAETTSSTWTIVDLRVVIPDPHKSLCFARDPLGAALASLRCIPPRLQDSKLTQANSNLRQSHLQLQVSPSPLVGSAKWVCSESDIIFTLRKAMPANLMNDVTLLPLSLLFTSAVTSALADSALKFSAVSIDAVQSRLKTATKDQDTASGPTIPLCDYYSTMQVILAKIKFAFVRSLLDNVISAVFSLIDGGCSAADDVASQMTLGDRSIWFTQAPLEDGLDVFLEIPPLIESLTARGESTLEAIYDRDPVLITWFLRVLHNLLHSRVPGVTGDSTGAWRQSPSHQVLSLKIRKAIQLHLIMAALDRLMARGDKILTAAEDLALTRMKCVLLTSPSGSVTSIRKLYADRADGLHTDPTSSSNKKQKIDNQEIPEHCTNCDASGLTFDPSQPFESTCGNCNAVHDRCCLSLRLLDFNRPIFRCHMCSSVCRAPCTEDQSLAWLSLNAGMCPFCLVLMDRL